MVLQKIISGAQTGADRAALDVAILYDIPHGGWVPKGRKAEDGVVPDEYKVTEMISGDYKKRTEQNVIDSDGTIIFSHGKLAGGSMLTLEYAHKHDKPCLHINLDDSSGAAAVTNIIEWINDNQLENLNCAGSRASKDPKIYNAVFSILDAVLSIYSAPHFCDYQQIFDLREYTGKIPETVSEAAETLIDMLSIRERVILARVEKEEDLIEFHFSLGLWIRNAFELWDKDSPLFKALQQEMDMPFLHPDDASAVVIEKAWEKVNPEYDLRVVR